MERYTVSIPFPKSGSNLQLLIPFLSTSSILEFGDEVKKRSEKQGFPMGERVIFFRLEQDDGPILDMDDRLNEVIVDPRSEKIFVTFQNTIPEVMRTGREAVSLLNSEAESTERKASF